MRSALRQRLERGLEPQVLPAGEERVEGRLLQRRADPRPHLRPLVDDVETGHARGARGRRKQRRQHVHGRRLAGAVGAEEAVNLARGNGEVDRVDRARALLELADELLGLDRGLVHGLLDYRDG